MLYMRDNTGDKSWNRHELRQHATLNVKLVYLLISNLFANHELELFTKVILSNVLTIHLTKCLMTILKVVYTVYFKQKSKSSYH